MEINFIPPEEKKKDETSPVLKAFIIGAVTFAFLFSILLFRYLAAKIILISLNSKESAIVASEEGLKDFKESFEKYKVHPAMSILKNHTYFSDLFSKIEDIKPAEIEIKSLDTDTKNLIKIQGKTAIFRDFLRFLEVLRKQGFTDLDIKNSTVDEDNNFNFSIEFKFSKEMVLRKK